MYLSTLIGYVLLPTCLALPNSLEARQSTTLTNLNLRILPLGDSITYGLQSTDGAGYRRLLYTTLTAPAANNTVNMIGSIRSGSIADPDNEGTSGALISQIATYAQRQQSLPSRPNVVLLHAGTNDCVWGGDSGNAPSRLASLMDEITTACPDALLLVAQIIRTSDSASNTRIQTFNAALPAIVNQRSSQGKKVRLVDMYDALQTSDLSDGIHPNNGGYDKMANVWLQGMANAKSLITPPVTV